MVLTINRDQLPIKFILGIEQGLEGYPDPLDLLYYYVNMSYRNPSRYKDTFTKHNILQYSHPDADPAIVEASLQKLINDGYIEQTKNEPGKETYKIIINPFQWLQYLTTS